MGETSRRTFLTILTALLFFAPAGTVAAEGDCNALPEDERAACEEKRLVDACDVDGDGALTSEEELACKETHAGTEAARDETEGDVDEAKDDASDETSDDGRDDGTGDDEAGGDALDCNKDGRVDEKEETFEHCPETGGEARSHPCAEFRDAPRRHETCLKEFDQRCEEGTVREENARFCKEPPRQDDPREPRPCDADGDGAVGERERAACKEAFDQEQERPGPGKVSEECRASLQDQGEARKAFEESQREKREAFHSEQRAAYDEFGSANRTEDEWADFKEEREAEREAFEDEMRASRDAFEAEHGRPEACKAPEGDAAQQECAPDPRDYERFKLYVDDQDRRFRDDLQVRIERFEADHAGEEDAPKARAAFEADLEEARLKHRAYLESLWEEFRAKHAKDCLRGADAPRGEEFRGLNEDVREDRLQCRIDFQGDLDAFYEANGDRADAWDEATLEAYLEIKRAVREEVQACEKRLHEAWKEEAKQQLGEERKEDRFGEFSIEGSGDGEGSVTGKWVTFDYELGSLTIRDYAVQGLVLFDEFYAPHAFDAPKLEGRVLVARGEFAPDECQADAACAPEALALRVHDNPGGRFDVQCRGADAEEGAGGEGDEGDLWLTLPEGVGLTGGETGDDGATKYALDYGDGQTAILRVRGDHAWSDDGTVLESACGFDIVLPSENFVQPFANKHRDEITDAVEEGAVLAEVDIVLAEDGGLASDSQEFSDTGDTTNVDIERPEEGDGVVVTVDAEGNAGKTGVFNVDSALFEVDDLSLVEPDDFVVTYWDVADDGTKTEVAIEEADGLADVLDPSEDAPEYWVVLDKDGLQLLVSFPHFSTKQVQIQSAGVAQPDGSDVDAAKTPFAGALAVAAAVAVAALVPGRRRK